MEPELLAHALYIFGATDDLQARASGAVTPVKDLEGQMPAAALAVGKGEPELEELVEQVVLARAEVDGVETGVADEAFDGLAVGLVGGGEKIGHDAVEDGIGEVLPAERVEGAGVAGGGREDGELGGAVRGTLAELVGGVDDDLARELVGMVAGETRDGLAGNADDHRFGAVEGLAHRFLGRARPVADLVSGRGERLTQRPADLACADDCDVHQISFAFPRVLPETAQARWRCINARTWSPSSAAEPSSSKANSSE